MTSPRMTKEEVEAFLDREFPELHSGGRAYSVESVDAKGATLRLRSEERHLRPGGTISGPAMMTLADVALYVAVVAHAGPLPLAVTTHLNFVFLRKPPLRDLLARCVLLKLGRRLATGEVRIVAEGSDELLCQATGTYALPSS